MPQEMLHSEVTAEMERLSSATRGKIPEIQKDVVRSAVRERITRVQNFSSGGAAPTVVRPTPKASSSVLPAYAAQSSEAQQLVVEQLVDLALRQGLDKAVNAATKQDAMVLDMFHDALTGKLYTLMRERKLI